MKYNMVKMGLGYICFQGKRNRWRIRERMRDKKNICEKRTIERKGKRILKWK